MKTIRLIAMQITLLLVATNTCFGQSKGEIVAKNGIYAIIKIIPKDNWPIIMDMFFSECDTIHISMDNLDETIESILKGGEFVSIGMTDTVRAVVDIFNCSQQQGFDVDVELSGDLNRAKKKRKMD